MKIKLTVEYLGDSFHGFQTQESLPTVQEELEKALEILTQSELKKAGHGGALESRLSITGSGRTDSGVHARGQVVSFVWPDGIAFERTRFLSAMNGITPKGLAVLDAEQMPDSFDARHSPHIKLYTYRLVLRRTRFGIDASRAWFIQPALDLESMIRAAAMFKGQHNFGAFRAGDCSSPTTIRTIVLSDLTRIDSQTLQFSIVGKGFLKQMVRIIVGTLVEIGKGDRSPDTIPGLLKNGGERVCAGRTAPASGLTLEWVKYGDEWGFDRALPDSKSSDGEKSVAEKRIP